MNADLALLFSETFELTADRLTPDATLDSLGLDSLAVIEFLFLVEDKFGIKIPDQGDPPSTLGEMQAMIEPLLVGANVSPALTTAHA